MVVSSVRCRIFDLAEDGWMIPTYMNERKVYGDEVVVKGRIVA
jgi:hypothetical protein